MDHRAVARLAAKQLGVVSLGQLRELGIGRDTVQYFVDNGYLARVHVGVYRVRAARPTYEQRLLGACLAIDDRSAASHRAAATQHDLLRYRDPPVEVTTSRRHSPDLSDVVVHRLMDLHARWVVRVDGVPTTSVARTLVDLGAVASRRTVEAALDRAAGRKLVTYREVRDAMLAVARQGRRGVGTIRPLLAARVGEVIPVGTFSARMATLLRDAGLPKPEHEYTVIDEHGGFVAAVDFAYPDKRLAIEVDGYEFHSSPTAFKTRNQRDRLLADALWLVLHYSWDEVDRQSRAVGAEIRRHFSAR